MADHIIGFSNLDEHNPFTRQVREHLEAFALQDPQIDLIVRDNDLDTEKAKRNAQEFADANVDAAIIFHIDERANEEVVLPLRLKQIPIVCVDIPIQRSIYFGINNPEVGAMAGNILAEWINNHWNGQLDKTLVLTEYRILDIFRQRFDSAVQRLETHVSTFDRDHLLYLDNGGRRDITAQRVTDVMNSWSNQEHIAIICMNDSIARGALDAVRDLRRENHVAMLSYDGTPVAIEEFRTPNSPLIASPWLRPKVYGKRLLEIATQLVEKQHVPQWNYVEVLPLSRDNYQDYLDAEN